MATPYRVALFDADGVLVTPTEPFSHTYSRERGLDSEHMGDFFAGDFQLALRGKADVKDLITKHRDYWGWQDDPQGLLDKWFATEDHPNRQLLDYIQTLRANGLRCYLATDQEKHRQTYLQNITFKDTLDGVFASSEFGHVKREPAYFKKLIQKLTAIMPGLKPAEIIYFDDAQKNIDSAKAAGITAYLYTDIDQVKQLFAA
jgi:putative hydrolase of the HAD superfamily